MQAESKKNLRQKKSQRLVLEGLLEELEKNFLSREHIKTRFLNGRTSTNSVGIDVITLLDLIDSVRENFKTALQFEDYRRATRYFVMLQSLCEKFL